MKNLLSLSALTLLLMSGCDSSSLKDSDNLSNITKSERLSATNMDVFSFYKEEGKVKFLGECAYSDGSADPVVIVTSDPINSPVVQIAYQDVTTVNHVFSAYNNYGYVDTINNDGKTALNPNPSWDFSISEDGTTYKGIVSEGGLFECQLIAVLNAETKSDIGK